MTTLEMSDGGEAQKPYLRGADANASTEERERLRALMLSYCERDTWAMVRLANVFAPAFVKIHVARSRAQ